MRRKDREVTDQGRIQDILSRCIGCRLGFYEAGEVYIVPLNFGYQMDKDATVLYFHSAKEGRKIDLIAQNPSVGFELDTGYALHGGDSACSYSAAFESIIGTGKVSFVENRDRKSVV